MFKINYGLYVLSAEENGLDNGCIINTVMQVTDRPICIAFAVNKQNKTHDMVYETERFAISVLTEQAPFSLFEWFGFRSGRDTRKFVSDAAFARCENGVLRLTEYVNAYFAGRVTDKKDLGTHTLFLAELSESAVLSELPSVTYTYYHEHIKPKTKLAADETEKYVCKICGYVHEGPLPEDFVCPWCKHGAADFERV